MPYANDEELDKEALRRIAELARQDYEEDQLIRNTLKARFEIPDEFMDLAVKIWWDGKED